ncbi:redoxin domain-containing protein [Flavobacterium sp. Sd200]|uniref:TlpA family protein disulfide reductase n=1 Tax=Flavobacterium sp. Sd200 TaxID=2692211 RepID=UPI001369C589|nr:TlpA disulfide reductase family protein [Flavobacterium sp. Sd200]MXN91486.1 redoxin domain-containing protein [Flavobacterium sp. Sd200]
MKKIFLGLLFAATGVFAQADAVKFKAAIQNRNSDSLVIRSRTFTKTLKADAKGNFADSFSVVTGVYQLFDGSEYATLYLKNGFDLDMTMDAKQFDETIKFKGAGEKENNYLAQRTLGEEAFGTNLNKYLEEGNTDALNKLIDERVKSAESVANDAAYDEPFRNLLKAQASGEKQQLTAMVQQALAAKKLVGKPSPSFAYENAKGGATKLEEFKGKYVYIDVWATWCGPCRQEIPHLKKVEEKYHGKNIVFTSISVDTAKDHDKWKKMVESQSLGGVQLFADKDWKSDFIQAYGINSIPRFILIDPKGNVVDADAKRPSDPELQAQLDKLLK